MLHIELNTLFDQRYLITDRLGEGGMGLVFAAQDTQRGDLPCAIKVLQYQQQEVTHSIRRLTQERSVMAKLRHEHIVEIFDVVASSRSDEHYIVMPLLEGHTLKAWVHERKVAQEPVTIEIFLRLMCQVLDALHHAHRMGVVHRDLKPDNLFVCQEVETSQIKVLDFGIAKDLTNQDSITADMHGGMVGTPRYMSPEQIKNREVTPQTDLYAIAVLIYEYLIDCHPFDTQEMRESNPLRGMPTSVQMSWHHVNSTPPPLKNLGMLGELIASALEKDPQSRPKSAHLMCTKIKKWLSVNQAITQSPIPISLSSLVHTPPPEAQALVLEETPSTPSRLEDSDPKLTALDPSTPIGGGVQPSSETTRKVHSARRTTQTYRDLASSANEAQTSGALTQNNQRVSRGPRSRSTSLKILTWTLRVILLLFVIAWAWYLNGRPDLPFLNRVLRPLLTAICESGLLINDFFTQR